MLTQKSCFCGRGGQTIAPVGTIRLIRSIRPIRMTLCS
jgi:hypothetical protein